MNKQKQPLHYDSIVVFLVILLGILTACLPLRSGRLPGNYYPDLGYHLIRIEGIKEAILAGDFPARIYSFALNGWGYGGSMFYQDYLLYIPAFFRVCGVDIQTSYKLMIVMITIAIACTTYFSAKYISKSKYAASLITIALLLSQYYLADIYSRAGVSEYLAFIFVPVLIAGVYDTLAEDCKHPGLMGIALFGLLLTHSITFALGVVLLLVCFAINIPRFIKKPYQLIRLVKVAVVTILATAFIYIPLLEQMFSGKFRFHEPWAHVEEMTQPIATWFRTTGYFDTIAYVGVGIPVLFCLLLRFGKRKLENQKTNYFLAVGILLVVITSKYFPWKVVGSTILGFIQFPYRLYSYAIPVLTLGAGMLYAELFEKKKIWGKVAYLFLGAMIAFCGFLQLDHVPYADESAEIDEHYFEVADNTFYIGAEEWLPAGVKGKHLKKTDRNVVADDKVTIAYTEGYNEIVFSATEPANQYQIPLVYYKGYEAVITDEKGVTSQLPIMTDEAYTGAMWVLNPDQITGTVRVHYEGTVLQKVSMGISAVTILLLVIWYFKSFAMLKK